MNTEEIEDFAVGGIAGIHSVYMHELLVGEVLRFDEEEITLSFENGYHVQTYEKARVLKPNQVKKELREKLKENYDWISLKEYLPDNGQTVLLYCNEGVLLSFYNFWVKGAHGNSTDYFQDINKSATLSIDEATHWRQIPKSI